MQGNSVVTPRASPCYHIIPTRDFYTHPNQQEQEKGQEKDRKN